MRKEIKGLRLDEERALYHTCHADVTDCVFAGPADGESALKESADLAVRDCRFSLRYPLWHTRDLTLERVTMDATARAALWYVENGAIRDCALGGIKALRECRGVSLARCTVDSPEFGWKCSEIRVTDSTLTAEYLFLDSRALTLRDSRVNGKYAFQYVNGLEIDDCELNTKDAFWHSTGVTVRGSVIRGEYLGWYSKGLTLIGCKIIGTQPLCYCSDLRLIDCELQDADLAFEYSDVQADLRGRIDSVKNPRSGRIVADEIGELIRADAVMPCNADIVLRGGTGAEVKA
ncbi:MAG: DUF3737 family protein [Clostridia bacterium]|nr:DUF3737 family protein [Clostridia bacterium]